MSADGVCQPRGGYTKSTRYHSIVNKNDMGTGAVGADCCMSAMQAMNDCYAQSGFCDFGCDFNYLAWILVTCRGLWRSRTRNMRGGGGGGGGGG